MSRASTSLQIFHSHMVRLPDGSLDVSGLISKACYDEWLLAKPTSPSDDEARKYHRTLTNHVSGVDGRAPFDPDEEKAILTLLRKREPWPCFPKHLACMGRKYRAKGYHEKQALASPVSPTSVARAPNTLSISPRALPTSLQTSAAMQFQRQVPQDNLEQLFRALAMHDRKYVQDFTNAVITNFSSPNFSLQDWYTVNLIFRYMIIAKTPRCQLQLSRAQELEIAKRLCERFSHDEDTLVMVFDLTAESYIDRALYQNDYSRRVIGPILRNPNAKGVDNTELYSAMLAVGVSFICRGHCVPMYAQRNWCADDVVREFDMNFYVDPDSLLIVVWGKLTRPAPRLLAPPPAVTPPPAAPESDVELLLSPYNWENALPWQD